MQPLTSMFCVSVDSQPVENIRSIDGSRRRSDMIGLLEEFNVRSNWTIVSLKRDELPCNARRTVSIPVASRSQLRDYLRRARVSLGPDGPALNSVVADLAVVREFWDLLVRQGFTVARLRSTATRSDSKTRILRGGLWVTPSTCSFVGGTPRSVRSLSRVCRGQLDECVRRGGVFHLNVELGNGRSSWLEERTALTDLFEAARQHRRAGRLHSAHLDEIPDWRTMRTARPMRSVLRAA